MKKLLLFMAVLCVLTATGSVFAVTPVFDGVLDEWIGPGIVDLGTRSAPDAGNYTLLATWDASNLYLGLDRDSSDRYLGDTFLDNDSFFVAIDVDGIAGSGAASDGYGRMNFAGTMLPDFFVYYAGGGGWYETSSWNGSSMDWHGWSNTGTYYGWQEDNPDDELGISLATIGGSHEVMAWAWMTKESNGYVEASWPDGSTGDGPTVGDGVMIPEPATMTIMGLGSVLLASFYRKRS